jgi:hypothetical protein
MALPGEDEIGVLGLLDERESVARLDDAINVGMLVTLMDHEEVGAGSNDLVLAEREIHRLRAVRVAALAQEGGRIVLPGSGHRSDAFVYIAEEHLLTNERFERTGQRVLPSWGIVFGGTRGPPSAA